MIILHYHTLILSYYHITPSYDYTNNHIFSVLSNYFYQAVQYPAVAAVAVVLDVVQGLGAVVGVGVMMMKG